MGTTKDFIEQQGDWNVRHRMLDSEYIHCEHTSAGIRIHLLGSTGGDEGGDTYDGYFQTVNSTVSGVPETQLVKITSGYAVINNSNSFYLIDALLEGDDGTTYAAELTITAKAFIYLDCIYSGSAINTPKIKQSETFPTPVADRYKHLISVIEWDAENEVISSITRQTCGVIEGVIVGECV